MAKVTAEDCIRRCISNQMIPFFAKISPIKGRTSLMENRMPIMASNQGSIRCIALKKFLPSFLIKKRHAKQRYRNGTMSLIIFPTEEPPTKPTIKGQKNIVPNAPRSNSEYKDCFKWSAVIKKVIPRNRPTPSSSTEIDCG
tara:strand:+ start:38315 stop:38737 length:423 start_codon:yes stop_codon:yes gene_type:complete